MSEVACEIAFGLGAVPSGALVVAALPVADMKLDKPSELSLRMATVIAGRLAGDLKTSNENPSLARARTLASSARNLVYLRIDIALGQLRVSADLYPVPRRFWDRVRDPRPTPTAHAFGSRRLDAELRTFFPAVPLVAKQVQKAKAQDSDTVALACGDTDNDGALEIVVVGRRRIHIGRIRQGRLSAHAAVNWSELSPVAATPLREPIAGVHIEPGRFIDVGLSDRAYALRFDPSLALQAKLTRQIPWPDGGCMAFAGVALQGSSTSCAAGDATFKRVRFAEPTDTLAGARIVLRGGTAQNVYAARVANEGVALLHDDKGRTARMEGVGAQVAVGDLDLDGQPELVSGLDTPNGQPDAMVVRTWLDNGQLVERLRLPVPEGVRALTICPSEGEGLTPIVVATTSEIWIVR